ncbi:hypothetical protein DJ023_03280 [Pantoea agglomerans]|nr:hypothetical protein [Pantoea agglomerans]MBB1226743.1 DUF2655 domain-containing protein [Pantoea pleuroti]TKJ59979.1 hypothetical protein PagCFBP13505_05250 [Pantoea agglomerans]TKK15235.1 hypothetical protein PagCFBP13516_20690 [Pantoea agglomerans]TKK34603.1 hypothetical protein PagCFBP13532_12120 [Pantoea agglomerans]
MPYCCPGRNPQPAKCLISHYVLRHCCVSAQSGKMTISLFFCPEMQQARNSSIIPLLTFI